MVEALSIKIVAFVISKLCFTFDIVLFEAMDGLKSPDDIMNDNTVHCSETPVNRKERNFSCILTSKFQDLLKKIDLFALVFSFNTCIPFSTPYTTNSLTFSNILLIKHTVVCRNDLYSVSTLAIEDKAPLYWHRKQYKNF